MSRIVKNVRMKKGKVKEVTYKQPGKAEKEPHQLFPAPKVYELKKYKNKQDKAWKQDVRKGNYDS